MKIQVNGESFEFDRPLSVSQLLERRNAAQRHLAVEVNGEVVPRADHETTELTDGDQVEVVSLVGGG